MQKNVITKLSSVDLTPAIPYLDALETAESFPELFRYCQEHDSDYMLEEAMKEINKWCPYLWPYIDRAVLEVVSAGD